MGRGLRGATNVALLFCGCFIAACSETIETSDSLYLMTLRGRAALESGEIDSACKIFQKIARDHDDATAWANLGVAEERDGDHDAAERAWEAALRCDPNDARAHFLRARASLAEARTAREEARARPQDADRWDQHAGACLDSAHAAAQRALTSAPAEAAVHALIAAIASARGDNEAAARAQATARRLDPLGGGARDEIFARILLPAVPRDAASGLQSVHFEPTSLAARGTGLIAADLNGDARSDLIVLGSGIGLIADTFATKVVWQERALLPGATIQQALSAPFDRDAHPDVLLFARDPSPDVVGGKPAPPGSRAWLLRGDGRGAEPIGALPGAVRRVRALDIDRDADLDLVIATAGAPGLRLWRNDGTGRFEDITPAAWASLGGMADVVGADLDGDLTQDLVCAESGGRLRFLAQRVDATWTDLTVLAGLGQQRARSLAILDVEPDGTLDLLVGNEEGMWVFANRGGGRFVRAAAYRAPATTWWPGNVEHAAVGAIAVADCDADGRLDLTTLHPSGHAAAVVAAAPVVPAIEDAAPAPLVFETDVESNLRVWRADPSGVFLDATERLALDVRTARATPPVWSDFDCDGDLDLAVVAPDSVVQVYWNRGESANRLLRVQLSGDSGLQGGFGARLLVCAGGVVQNHLVDATSLEIGIGHATRLDAVHVAWTSGAVETRFDVPVPAERSLNLRRGRE